ncbi:MAG: ribonuclease [Verrucomicrobia bacterium]|nr:ribonuclease [Verrucomicrobiota bacterium]
MKTISLWTKILLNAGKTWASDNAFKHSAAVSFYTLFSIAPITIIAVTITGIFIGKEEAGRQLGAQISQLIGPASAEMIQAAAKAAEVQSESRMATTIGIVLLIVGATTVFGQLQDSLNSIWSVRAKPKRSGWVIMLVQRLVSFAMVLTVGFLLLVSLVLTTALTSALGRFNGGLVDSPALARTADLTVGLLVITVLFALLFKVLPDVKLRWRDVWLGALLTAILFTVGRYLIALYLGHSTVATIYGTAGSLVALLIWVYYSCAILFFGVEFTRAYRLAHELDVEPKDTAVRVREQIIEGRKGKLARAASN